ncbi:MAG: hypothetical protein QM487_15585 [Candidatus Marithrix sp.]
MTELLEQALQKATQELNEQEQVLLAKSLLQHNLLNEHVRFISKYNVDTQQTIKNTAEQKNLNHYHSIDELFAKL